MISGSPPIEGREVEVEEDQCTYKKKEVDVLWSEKECQCDTIVDYKLSILIWMQKTHQICVYAQTSVPNHDKEEDLWFMSIYCQHVLHV